MIKKGYIEGFYGRLMTQDHRSLILKRLADLSMDFYIYGPKEDPFHRSNWATNYPEDLALELRLLNNEGEKFGIKTYIALSPIISTEDDLKQVINSVNKKIKQFKDIGFKRFALFFDDVDFDRDDKLAKVHSEILNSINQDQEDPIIFCPTVYCNNFARGEISESSYLKELSKNIPIEMPMLWTGKEVVSKNIDDEDISSLNKIFKNPIIIWDNYYANDYCPRNLFIGEYKGREFLEHSPIGIGLNATGLPLTDSIILSQFKGLKTTQEILKDFGVPSCFNEVFPFFEGPFDRTPSLKDIEGLEGLLKLSAPLCIEWKSNLQLEWAPYLWSFFIDLNLLVKNYKNEDQKVLEEWASRRYSKPIMEVLFRDKENK
tara:strand:- start:8030 stop:9151 length:1122 start_codon:yes stop_codon:yes gene_type:complete